MRPSLRSFYEPPPRARDSATVVGCYLWPHRFLEIPDYEDPLSALEARWTVAINDADDLIVTVNGGLFSQVPEELAGLNIANVDPTHEEYKLRQKMQFEEKLSERFNLMICELATWGVVSEPAAPPYIWPATVLDGHILGTGAGGGREAYFARCTGWSEAMVRGTWKMAPKHPEVDMQEVIQLRRSDKIAKNLSSDAPTLVATTYSAFSRMHHAETLTLAWTIVEQYLEKLWMERLTALPQARRSRLKKDNRNYTAAIRTEILNSDGVISDQDRELMDRVRNSRNNLAHRGNVDHDGARDAAELLRRVLTCICVEQVEPLVETSGIGW